MRLWPFLICVAICEPRTNAAPFEDDPTVRAMKDELARSMDKLELPGFGKPYFLSYSMWDMRRARVSASFGALVESEVNPRRTVDINLRVGDYAFDNSNVSERDRSRSITLPSENNYDNIRRELWLATDRQYKHAVETLERKRAVAKAETKSTDDAPSFSKEPPSHVVDERVTLVTDQAVLETLARRLSAVFRGNPDVHEGTVTITAGGGKQVFVSSEGAASIQTGSYVRIDVECQTQADDGMSIHDSFTLFAEALDQLPPEAEMVAQVEKLSRELSAIRTAPVVDDFAGPVLFTGAASGQVVRALLAENVAGTPAPKGDHPGARSIGESELVGKIGQRILPVGTSVIDDPTIKRAGKTALVGDSRFDEEGVASQKVSLVENGTLKRFLMSRIPRKGFEHSNGHALSTPYAPVRAHPMNLIVSSTKGVSEVELRRRALAAAKEQDLKYILVVEKLDLSRPSYEDFDPSMLSGDASIPKPAVMKRVYLDGHEELVRGATFGALPVRVLKDLLAIGSTPTVYNYTGSGMPSRYAMFVGDTGSGYFVSIVTPALLFRDVDIKKPVGPHRTAPIAPRPK